MNCKAEKNMVSDIPAPAGTLRFFMGLTVLICGLIFGLSYEGHGQGLGFLLVLASPFIFLEDKPKLRQLERISSN